MCMFNRFRREYPNNVVNLYSITPGRDYPVDDALRFVGRIVHKAVRRVVVKAYWWNKVADCR